MTKPFTRNARRKQRKTLASVRELLQDYGCENSETTRKAVERLIAEHLTSLREMFSANTRADSFRADALLAAQTRDGAQALATKNHEEARGLRRENEQLRDEIETLRAKIVDLRNEPRISLRLPDVTEPKLCPDCGKPEPCPCMTSGDADDNG